VFCNLRTVFAVWRMLFQLHAGTLTVPVWGHAVISCRKRNFQKNSRENDTNCRWIYITTALK